MLGSEKRVVPSIEANELVEVFGYRDSLITHTLDEPQSSYFHNQLGILKAGGIYFEQSVITKPSYLVQENIEFIGNPGVICGFLIVTTEEWTEKQFLSAQRP